MIMMIRPINPQMPSAFYIFTLAILKEEQKNEYNRFKRGHLSLFFSCHKYCQIHQQQYGCLIEAT